MFSLTSLTHEQADEIKGSADFASARCGEPLQTALRSDLGSMLSLTALWNEWHCRNRQQAFLPKAQRPTPKDLQADSILLRQMRKLHRRRELRQSPRAERFGLGILAPQFGLPVLLEIGGIP